jgi:hypothetical protein
VRDWSFLINICGSGHFEVKTAGSAKLLVEASKLGKLGRDDGIQEGDLTCRTC